MWLMLYKRCTFEMVLINPGSKGDNGSRNPAYLAKNRATIPCLEEVTTGFCVGEAHAILTYLATKHGWTDVYQMTHTHARESTGTCIITIAMSRRVGGTGRAEDPQGPGHLGQQQLAAAGSPGHLRPSSPAGSPLVLSGRRKTDTRGHGCVRGDRSITAGIHERV